MKRLLLLSLCLLPALSAFAPIAAADDDPRIGLGLLAILQGASRGRSVNPRFPQIGCPGEYWRRESTERNYRIYLDRDRPVQKRLAPQHAQVKRLTDHQDETLNTALAKFYELCDQARAKAAELNQLFEGRTAANADPNNCEALRAGRATYADAERKQNEVVQLWSRLHQEVYDLSQSARTQELREINGFNRRELPDSPAMQQEVKQIYGHGGMFQRSSGVFWRLRYGVDVIRESESDKLSSIRRFSSELDGHIRRCGSAR